MSRRAFGRRFRLEGARPFRRDPAPGQHWPRSAVSFRSSGKPVWCSRRRSAPRGAVPASLESTGITLLTHFPSRCTMTNSPKPPPAGLGDPGSPELQRSGVRRTVRAPTNRARKHLLLCARFDRASVEVWGARRGGARECPWAHRLRAGDRVMGDTSGDLRMTRETRNGRGSPALERTRTLDLATWAGVTASYWGSGLVRIGRASGPSTFKLPNLRPRSP